MKSEHVYKGKLAIISQLCGVQYKNLPWQITSEGIDHRWLKHRSDVGQRNVMHSSVVNINIESVVARNLAYLA